MDTTDPELRGLQTFVVQLGAAMNAAGVPVDSVQQRLARVAGAYGARKARITAFPTYLMVTMGRGELATLELTTVLGPSPRLDQISALDRLVDDAERGLVPPVDGLRRLREIRELRPRFGTIQSIVGYAVFSLGICLILHPVVHDVAAAAFFGALVGWLRVLGRGQPTVQVLMPVVAAFCVSALSALAVEHDLTDPGLPAMVASLVVFVPGAALTTAVLELAAGQMVSGSSRLVSGAMQLALLAFGILAGIEAVGIPSSRVFASSGDLLGDWARWLGVLVFACGVKVANSTPAGSFPGLLVVLYAAWIGQLAGNALFGGYVGGLVGAVVMTIVASLVSRLPSAMPAYASFLPGFWLLVPGAIGLIGLTEIAGGKNSTGSQEFAALVGSIFAVALGVLIGTQLLDWAHASARRVGMLVGSFADRHPSLARLFRRFRIHD